MTIKQILLFAVSGLISVCLMAEESVEPAPGVVLPKKGIYQDLKSGDKLNLRIDGNTITVYIVNKALEILETDIESILVIIDNVGPRDDEWRSVLRPENSFTLYSNRRVYPPYYMSMRIIIRYPGEKTEAFADVDFSPEDLKEQTE